MKNPCTECGQDMDAQWPKIAHLLKVCLNCSKSKVKRILTYKMFGGHKAPN